MVGRPTGTGSSPARTCSTGTCWASRALERPAVVLAVNGFQDEARARKMLYTGMSRARSLLVLVGPRGDVERIGGEAARRRLASAEPWVPAQA